MFFNSVVKAVALLAASLFCYAVLAQTSSAPESRAQVKAETRAAEKAGKLTPPGQGPEIKVSPNSTKTRAQRKAETLAARKAGELEPAGEAEIDFMDQETAKGHSTVNRAALKAETRAEEKAGLLAPAGEHPGKK